MSGIRRTRRSNRGLGFDSFLNAFGYRLEALLTSGNEADVVRLLSCFTEEWRYAKSGELLAALGGGFRLNGHNSAAATAYSLACQSRRRRVQGATLKPSSPLPR